MCYMHESPICNKEDWIPCSKNLPEVEKDVLVSYHFKGSTEFFPPFDGVKISSWTGIINHNIPEFDDMGFDTVVTAWMPLPKPYKEECN